MLTAINKDGKLISLVDSKITEEVRAQSYYCPICQERLILKAGAIRIPHFAHMKNSECSTYVTEPESQQHLLGKKHLYSYLQKRYGEVYLEYYLQEIKQRPDLLFKNNGRFYVIEYQCSPISAELLERRTKGYEKIGITPYWLIGGYPYQQRKNNLFNLTQFHWSMIKIMDQQGLTLLSYHPETKNFYQMSHITPFSTSKVIATFATIPLHNPHYYKLEKPNIQQIYRNWLIEKRRWLQFKVHYSYSVRDIFLQTVYEAGFNPFLLPSICGIPTKSLFRSHPVEWQFYIYLDSFRFLKVGQRISMEECVRKLHKRIRNGYIHVRHFPLEHQENWKLAIGDYMALLVEKEYFVQLSKDLFEMRKNIELPTNVEEAYRLENEFFEQTNRLLK